MKAIYCWAWPSTTDQGAWSTAKMYFTVPPNGIAKLHFRAHFQAPGTLAAPTVCVARTTLQTLLGRTVQFDRHPVVRKAHGYLQGQATLRRCRKAAGRQAPRGLRRGRALWSVVSLAESAAFVAYEASSDVSALASWAPRCWRPGWQAALRRRPRWRDPAFAILVSSSSGVSNPSTVESRAASALASALPARAASRTAVVTTSRRAAAILESTSVRLGGLQPRDGGVSTCELGGQRCAGDSVGHLGVDLERRDPCRDVEGVLVHHRLEAVGGCHRGVVGRGDGAVHGGRGAVVRQLQAHTVGGALRSHHLVGETRVSELCSAAMLLPCAALEERLPAPVRCVVA